MSIYYKDWTINCDPKPIGTAQHDWEASHNDYDGEDQELCFTAKSFEECRDKIDAWHEEEEEIYAWHVKQFIGEEPGCDNVISDTDHSDVDPENNN